VWNHFLALEIEQYKADKTFRFFNKNSKDLTELKKQEDTQWLKEIPSTAIQQSIRSLDLALRQSFKSQKNRKGFPKFKAKKHWQGGFPLAMVGKNANQENNTFQVPNVGKVKTKYHRAIPSEFTTCNIKYEAGKWYLVLTVKVKKQPKSSGKSSVGIDINSLEYVTSDGEIIPIPRFLGESQAQVKRIQRRLARKVKGSSNRKKWQLRLARQHYKIKCQRLDFFHKISKYLVDNYDVICLEDLNVKAIQRFNGHITKDNSFAGFRQMVEYKAELYGKDVVIVDRFYASTKTCSNCGNVQPIALSERTYKCNCCGIEISRDYNAAVNINRVGSARIYACGDWSTTTNSSESVATLVCEAGSHVVSH
jgi:putative transposase